MRSRQPKHLKTIDYAVANISKHVLVAKFNLKENNVYTITIELVHWRFDDVDFYIGEIASKTEYTYIFVKTAPKDEDYHKPFLIYAKITDTIICY